MTNLLDQQGLIDFKTTRWSRIYRGIEDQGGPLGVKGGRGLKDKLKCNKGKSGDSSLDDLEPGNLYFALLQGLVKGDMIGLSDPYAVISYLRQIHQQKRGDQEIWTCYIWQW